MFEQASTIQEIVRASEPRGATWKIVLKQAPIKKCSGKHPAGEKVLKKKSRTGTPIAQFFRRVTRFSGFRQVKIAGKNELEMNEIREEGRICYAYAQ